METTCFKVGESNFFSTLPNTISFWSENQEIFSVGVEEGKAFLRINPNVEPDVAGTEAAKIFWKQFETSLKEYVNMYHYKKYGDDLK
jgi:hypothetical protein